MYIINIHYLVSLKEVDLVLDEHRKFLKVNYQNGIFLLSGPKNPRNGGIILAKGIGKAELELIMRTDPFIQNRIATYDIIEFNPNMSGLELECLLT